MRSEEPVKLDENDSAVSLPQVDDYGTPPSHEQGEEHRNEPDQEQEHRQDLQEGEDEDYHPEVGNNLYVDSASEAGDSAIGIEYGDDAESISQTLSSSIANYRVENGRTYHQYKDGQYAYPNDEPEKDRLDLQHHLYRLTLDGKLYLAPIKPDVHNVIDVGTGTGIWALEFADEHPSADVLGTDLSPIQPQFVPPNLTFMIDDASEEWIFRKKFDFIHARQLHCAVPEKRLMAQAYENLVPGGWLEMAELTFPVQNDDGTLSPDMPIYQWSSYMVEASRRIGQSLENPKYYAPWMREAGFVNVQCVVYKWPANPWPRGKKEKTLGLWNMINTLDGLEGFTMAIFTRVLGWAPEEVTVFLAGVRNDTRNRNVHNYYPM
jgi:hypothetical protein